MFWAIRPGSQSAFQIIPKVFNGSQGSVHVSQVHDWHAAARPWKPISRSSQTNSYCADIVSRGSLELGSECCNRGQTIFMLYSLQHSVVPFCEHVWPTTSRLSHC
jgi:hypothetical protein